MTASDFERQARIDVLGKGFDCLLLTPSFARGGAERAQVNLANALHKDGLRVGVLGLTSDGPLRADLSKGVVVGDLGSERALSAILPLSRLLGKARPRIVISALDHLNVLAIVANHLAGRPTQVAVVCHRHISSTIRLSSLWRERHLMAPAIWMTYRAADHVVALTQAMASDLARVAGLPEDRIKVLPNVMTVEETNEPAELHPWLLQSAVPVLVGMGRLDPQKNFHLTVKAVERVATLRDVKLLIYGEGPLRQALQNEIDARGLSGNAELVGLTSSPIKVLSHADAFVLSSDYEGLPMVLVEALSAGCPVIATDCPTGPAEILGGGRFGKLVDMGDDAELATAIIETLDATRNPDALKAAAARYAPATVVPAYRAALDILGQTRNSER